MLGCEPAPPRPPGPWLEPENNMTMLVPAPSICARTRDLAPSPIDCMKITAPTPMMMPSAVRKERILFRVQRDSREAQGFSGRNHEASLRTGFWRSSLTTPPSLSSSLRAA